jgi:protein TonB
VDSSSGHPRLDEAARAALSLCRFKAGTVDGRPEKSWAKLRYVWKIG